MNEPDENQKTQELRKLGLICGFDASENTIDCLYLDEDVCGKMNATTAHEIATMTAEAHVGAVLFPDEMRCQR